MNIYLDTGFFVDCFSRRSLAAVNLRKEARRGRTINQIQDDADKIMARLHKHNTLTSVITMQEYANSVYSNLKQIFKGMPEVDIHNRITMKQEAIRIVDICKRKSIKLSKLTEEILNNAIRKEIYANLDLYDATHIETAIFNQSEVIISTDYDLLKFDYFFQEIRIMDTDIAINEI